MIKGNFMKDWEILQFCPVSSPDGKISDVLPAHKQASFRFVVLDNRFGGRVELAREQREET
jgi:hypothetical protein